VSTPTGQVPVITSGSCSDDPWLKGGTCGGARPNVDLANSFGWAVQIPQDGPLSRNVFDPALVMALVSKQASSPPNAPVDLDPVRWPEPEGKFGRVFWRAPDVSGNRWIFAFDIEYSASPDSAFSNAGRVMGPGAKSTLSPKDIPHYYYTTFPVGDANTYFRVCSVNDSGRQCSAPKPMRAPTLAEVAVINRSRSGVTMVSAGGGGTPPSSAPPTVARPVGPVVAPPPPAGLRPPIGPR
jgi:hypothetical protein